MIYVAYFVLTLTILVAEFWRKKRVPFDYLSYFNAVFVFAYIVAPLLLSYYSESDTYTIFSDEIFFLTLLSYFSALVGWVLGRKSERGHVVLDDSKIVKIINRYTIFAVLVTVVYIIGKGGLANLIAAGVLVRYGYEESTPTLVDFMRNLCSVAEIITYVLFAMWLSDRFKSHHKRIGINYLIVLSLHLVFAMSISSRGAVLNIIIMHTLILIYFRRGFIKLSIPILSFTVLLTLYGKQLFFAVASLFRGIGFNDAFIALNDLRLSDSNEIDVIHTIIREYAHTTESLIAAVSSADEIGYTYFSDFFFSLFRVIPQKIIIQFVEFPATISTINTSLLTGVSIASTPPGLMAHFYYALGSVGIVAGFFLYGLIGRKISESIANAMQGCDVVYAIYAYTGLLFGFFVGNGDPNVFIYSVLWPVVVYYSILRSRLRSRRSRRADPLCDAGHKMSEAQ